MNSRSTCMRTTYILWWIALSASASHISDRSCAERRQYPWSSGRSWNWAVTKTAWQYWKSHYTESALADKVYRNRDNLTFCKMHGIRLSGPRLGRPKKDASVDKKRNTLTMQTAWKLNGHSASPSDAMGLAGS